MKEQNDVGHMDNVINMILFFYCSIAWCSDTHVTNMILLFCCSIAWCSDTYVINNFSQVIPMFLQFYRYSLSVTTKPSYTTSKEQHHISHMGIRTPSFITTKEYPFY
jgi:hypothetical protein